MQFNQSQFGRSGQSYRVLLLATQRSCHGCIRLMSVLLSLERVSLEPKEVLTPSLEHDDGLKGIPPGADRQSQGNLEGHCKKCRASGVLSRTAKPVPPLRSIKLYQVGPSVQSHILCWIWNLLSGTILTTGVSHFPSAANIGMSAFAVLSEAGFSDAVSETIKIATASFAVGSECAMIQLTRRYDRKRRGLGKMKAVVERWMEVHC